MSEVPPSLDEIFALTSNHDCTIQIREDHRLFDTLHDITLMVSAIGIACGAVMHKGLIDTSGKTFSLTSDHFQKSVFLFMNDIFQLAMEDKRPDRISMAISRIFPPPAPVLMSSHGFDSVMDRPLVLPIAAFFDRHLPFVRSISNDSYRWPEPFNFFRVVRNGIAHGGVVDFRNAGAAPVSWRGITFSAADHGSKLISSKFFLADMLLLLLDADRTLETLGAPHNDGPA
jgi:hypothetical protein